MEILPAIDLLENRCVRLNQGDYARETVFDDDPPGMAAHWERLGAKYLHVVDLEGARQGHPCQLDMVAKIVKAVKIPVELGGGIRTTGSRVASAGCGGARV